MNFVIYARISPRGSGYDADNETSIPMQLQYCRDYARLHGGEVVGEFVDAFASGMVYADNVPLFNAQLAELAKDTARLTEELNALDVQAEIASRDAGQEIAGILATLRDMKTVLRAARQDPDMLRAFARQHIRRITRIDAQKWEMILNVTEEKKFVYLEKWQPRFSGKELFQIKIVA